MALRFPFVRGTWYSFQEFEVFEKLVLEERRRDQQFDVALGVFRERWMKVRSNELYPVLRFARHRGIEGISKFRLCDEGADADVDLMHGEKLLRLQVTTAGPASFQDENWGLDHVLFMEKLKVEGEVTGTGPFRREKDGSISNCEDGFSTSERDARFLSGLIRALRGKEHHRVPNCELLVNAQTYCDHMDCEDFLRLAGDALASVPVLGFKNAHIFDNEPGYIISRKG